MANFETALAITLDHEKGYQNNPADKGNYNSRGELVGTNLGISAPVYESYIGHPPSVAEMKAISRPTAAAIYLSQYWNPYVFSNLPDQDIANQLFDIAVLQGGGKMGKIVQQALNSIGYPVTVDGAYGSETRATINKAINEYRRLDLNNAIAKIREGGLSSVDFPGWIARAESYLLDASSIIKKKILCLVRCYSQVFLLSL